MTSLVSGAKHPHPAIFAVLLYPFGAQAGFLTVAIAYDLSQAGVSVEAIGILIAVSFIPNTWKFLWAPVVDTTLTPATWYTAAAVITGLGMLVMGTIPPTGEFLWTMTVVVFISSLTVTFTSMSAEVIGAHISPMDQKGRFGGWMQVGNFLGTGVGGGLALWLSQHLQYRWISSAVTATSVVLCPLALFWVPKVLPRLGEGTAVDRVVVVAKDTWQLARSRAGALAILILFSPIGTGAASNLWAAVAGDWHASADAVVLSNGAWSGVISGIGCLVGGYLCDKIDRKWAYALFGLVQAACAVAMGISPRTELMYEIYTLLYAFTSGLTYASFSGLTLEVIGGKAAATKYNLLASLSNFPIQYMTLLDGHAHTVWGAAGMLYTEAAAGVIAVAIYVAIRKIVELRSPSKLPAVDPV